MNEWDELTPAAPVLDDVRTFLARFVAFPTDWALDAVTLWVAHTHALDAFESTPRLALLSPEPGSGKSRTLEAVELLVPRPLFSLNASAAALFRKVSDPDGRPTVLLDEADTVFGPRAAKEHEDLRGFVNGGHRRGAMATRCVVRGKEITVEDYPCYAAVALAGLDDLPDTIMSRSIVVRMRRRAPDEVVEPFRHRVHGPDGIELRDRLAAWVGSVEPALTDAWPQMPEQVADRAADVWEPLVTIADQAGGRWPDAARRAAVTAVTAAQGSGETLGIRLLRDLRSVFEDAQADRMFTATILEALCGMDESPWGDLRGKALDARGLSRRLSKYDIRPHSVRHGAETAKGYELTDLADVFRRYLPARDVVTDVTAPTGDQDKPVTQVTDNQVGWCETYIQTDVTERGSESALTSPLVSVTSVTASQRLCDRCSERLDQADDLPGATMHARCESAEAS